MDTPNSLLIIVIGTFLLGWVIGRIGGALKARRSAKRRDPRDDRIRSLEAELRISASESEKAKQALETATRDLHEARDQSERRDHVISEQQQKIIRLRDDLKDSVRKTRELRAELSERAEESVRSEVKLREVETELSVAQASTEFIATGVLDYSLAPEADDDEEPGTAKSMR